MLEDLQEGIVQGVPVFNQFVLEYPDFIECDDLNGKIVTKHTKDKVFRVWNMADYSLCYVIQQPDCEEFKIW